MLLLGHQVNRMLAWYLWKKKNRKTAYNKLSEFTMPPSTYVRLRILACSLFDFWIFPLAFDIEIYWNYVIARFSVISIFSYSALCFHSNWKLPVCFFFFFFTWRLCACVRACLCTMYECVCGDDVICNEHKIDGHTLMRQCVSVCGKSENLFSGICGTVFVSAQLIYFDHDFKCKINQPTQHISSWQKQRSTNWSKRRNFRCFEWLGFGINVPTTAHV